MESKVFTLQHDEVLIDLVRENPVLYDFSNPNYKDQMVKHNVWKKIAATVGRDVAQCQVRWKTIRDTHRRNLNKMKAKTTTGSPAFVKSKYSNKALTFLDSTFKERKVVTNMPDPSGSQQEVDFNYDIQTEDTGMENEQAEQLNDNVEDTSFPEQEADEETEILTKKRKMCAKERLLDEIKTSREQRNKILEAIVSGKQHETECKDHPVTVFFSSMAEVVKSFPPDLIAEARLKVCQIVTEIELRALRRTTPISVPLNIDTNPQSSNVKVYQLVTPSTTVSSDSDSYAINDNDSKDNDNLLTTFIKL